MFFFVLYGKLLLYDSEAIIMKSDEIIYCSRCGNELNRNARSCLKCGSINYEHPDNQNMKKYEAENKDYVYEIGQGQTINGSNAKNKIFNPSHTGNQKLCYLLNSLIYVGILVLYGLICLISSDFVFDDFVYIKI